MKNMEEYFRHAAHKASEITGTFWAFLFAVLVIVLWLITGPLFNFSDTWQLVVNTGTTIVTFLMVFLIQNTQNRDIKAVHLKLDELIRTQKSARNSMLELEDLSDRDLEKLQSEFQKLYEKEKHKRKAKIN